MTTSAWRSFAPAKINLALHVTGQREDGYHLLDSLVAFAGVGDEVILSPGPEGLSLTGPEAASLSAGEDNIITRVIARHWQGTPLSVRLDKHLPVASGIGGGSADAAACYRALAALQGEADRTEEARLLAPAAVRRLWRIGADIPVCVASQPARMSGIGEELTPLPELPELPILLVNPRQPVATGPVFAGLARRDNAPLADLPTDLSDVPGLIAWLAAQRNDLEAPAIAIAPVIGEVIADIKAAQGCCLARMSGSGATCFGLFEDMAAAEAAAAALHAARPGWWIRATRLDGGRRAAPQLIRATT